MLIPGYAPNIFLIKHQLLKILIRYRKWVMQVMFPTQIKSSLYSPYYAEACNELRGPSPRLSAWATQLRRNVATVASRWRHCVDLTGPGIEPQTSRTDSVRLATELTTPTTRHRCGVSSELCSPGARPRRWAPQLVTRFGVIRRV